MNKLKYWIAAIIFTAGVGGAATTALLPQAALANEADEDGCSSHFLTMPTWYRGVVDGNCNIIIPGPTSGEGASSTQSRNSLAGFIWTIALNVVEIMLHIVGYVAVGYIIYGGFKYLTSTGQPDKVTGAKRTVMNATIGLVISVFAIAIVNVIVGAFSA